jgi:methylthioribose-1-phosphate isomerase
MRARIPMKLIVDSAAAGLFGAGKIDVVLFGADRVAANGDVANKVGTFGVCVLAREHGVPTYACVPTATIDLTTATGAAIPIEERGADEVTQPAGAGSPHTAPAGVPVYNPAFDVTPAKYITGIITEEGVCYRPFETSLRRAKEAADARIAAAAAAAAGSV